MTPFCTNWPISIAHAQQYYQLSEAQRLVRFSVNRLHVSSLFSFFIGSSIYISGDVKKHLDRDRILVGCLSPRRKSSTCRDLLIRQYIWRVFTIFTSNSLHLSRMRVKYSVSLSDVVTLLVEIRVFIRSLYNYDSKKIAVS
jgi:hypothetical protein